MARTLVFRWAAIAAGAAVVLGLVAGAPSAAQAASAPSAVDSAVTAPSPLVWSAPEHLDHATIESIACPTARLCVAADLAGRILATTHPTGGAASWKAADVDGAVPIVDLSCPSAAFCVALGKQGTILTSTDPAGGAARWKVTSVPAALDGVTCLSSALCIGSSSTTPSGVYTSRHPAGGTAAWILSTFRKQDLQGPSAIVCPTKSLCVGSDGRYTLGYTARPASGASAWRPLEPGPDFPILLQEISCPSASVCVASGVYPDVHGLIPELITSTDPTGGSRAWHEHESGYGWLVDCPAAAECFQFRPCILGSPCTRQAATAMLTTTDIAARNPVWKYVSGPIGPGAASCPTVSLCVTTAAQPGDVVVGVPPRRGATSTSVHLSAARLTYRHEQAERFSVSVLPLYPQFTRMPTGKIVITTGKRTICAVQLRRGRATCTLTARELRPGKRSLRVSYLGTRLYLPSASPRITLPVAG
jgi:hypothetical protein